MDTVIFGDVVDTGMVAEVDHNKYGLLTDYLPFSLEAVTINDMYYAVPTYVWGNFLMAITIDDILTSPLSYRKDSFGELDTVLKQCKDSMINHKITLLGNVEGFFTLPLFYIDSYIDK